VPGRSGNHLIGAALIGAALATVIGGAMLVAGAAPVAADEQATEAQILDALKAKRLTRCPDASAVSGCGGAPLAHPAREKPGGERSGIDVEIHFGTASAIPGRTEISKLTALGSELGKPGLTGAVFLVAGHTDAKGGAWYNQRLSQWRAEAVKRVLVTTFKLPVGMVIAVGYGKMQLKNTADPFASENRRVRIVNTDVK
jgi:outer membrane protein OmpA-like peptidoglycan-associated protein